jgi:hypothetical protein
MDFFCIILNILKNSLFDIFMRCLSYRLIKIHRRFTSAYLLCDKACLSPWYIAVTGPAQLKEYRTNQLDTNSGPNPHR